LVSSRTTLVTANQTFRNSLTLLNKIDSKPSQTEILGRNMLILKQIYFHHSAGLHGTFRPFVERVHSRVSKLVEFPMGMRRGSRPVSTAKPSPASIRFQYSALCGSYNFPAIIRLRSFRAMNPFQNGGTYRAFRYPARTVSVPFTDYQSSFPMSSLFFARFFT
jgi:hypothetical protein